MLYKILSVVNFVYMNIYNALSSGKWVVHYRVERPTFLRVGGVSVPFGEEIYKFSLELSEYEQI